MSRRCLASIVVLAAALHGLGIARTVLPAQDGIKFIRFARAYHTQPWIQAVRDADQHPLYPALIALTQPVVASANGPSADSWRIAAQLVSTLASLALLIPLFGWTRSLFDESTASLAVFLFVLLPQPAEIGHDTLSDPLALFAFTTALWCGERTLRSPSLASALGCGLASGLGFLARPEVAVLPAAVLATAMSSRIVVGLKTFRHPNSTLKETSPATMGIPPLRGRFAVLCVVFLSLVGAYALVKGEVSEKLALRRSAAIPSRPEVHRKAKQWLPPGLDDPRWDFSPKEESDEPTQLSLVEATTSLFRQWFEVMAWLLAILSLVGAVRVKAGPGARLAIVYSLFFGILLVRHASLFGYLSSRHVLTLVVISIPWAAAEAHLIGQRLAQLLRWDEARARRWGTVAILLIASAGIGAQLKPTHASRWGHWAAGRWLAQNAKPGEALLDTRGWASFVSGLPHYDYWHVRQAFTDSRLSYIVVGADELAAQSRRAETLRAILAYACEPAAAFPERRGGNKPEILIYRFRQPDSWEGLKP